MKILIHFRHFPVAMGRWFDWAFRDLGHEVKSVGCYQGDYIPWNGGMNLGCSFPPDFEIPEVEEYPISSVIDAMQWTPDVVFQASDVTYLSGKAPCRNMILKTDPHAVDYTKRIEFADDVLNMQHSYLQDGETWIPYAYFKGIHKYLDMTPEHDVVFSGLQYEHRVDALNKMKERGLSVDSTLGLVYEKYVEHYNNGKIAFNWSSKNDLPARFWEGLAMRNMVLTNKVPDLELFEFKDGIHYVTFDDVEDAVDKAAFYSKNDVARNKIALAGWKAVQPHHYHNRVKNIL